MFGTLETWLVHKLTGGDTYVTDITNASATGLYDPFDLNWGVMVKLLDIPINIFPKVVNNDYKFGMTRGHFFGTPIEISCVVSYRILIFTIFHTTALPYLDGRSIVFYVRLLLFLRQ